MAVFLVSFFCCPTFNINSFAASHTGRAWVSRQCRNLPSPPVQGLVQRLFLITYHQHARHFLNTEASSHVGEHKLQFSVNFDESGNQKLVSWCLHLFTQCFPTFTGLPDVLPLFNNQQDKRILPAASLDDWLGGSYWRVVSSPRSKHCSVISPATECKLSLVVSDLSWVSHCECVYCTSAVAYKAKTHPKFNPLFLLAGSDKFPSSLQCNVLEVPAFRMFTLTFEAMRNIDLNSMYYRGRLVAEMSPVQSE